MLIAPLAPVAAAAARSRSALNSGSRKNESQQKRTTTDPQHAQSPGSRFEQQAPSAVAITATKTDSFVDSDADGKAELGETISYTVNINNSGTTDALAVAFSDTLDANTTLVAGSVHAQPQARANSYSTVGNTLLEVSNTPSSTAPKVTATGTLFDNDGIATDSFQLQSFQATSANGGTVSVNADGSFTYLPAVNFTGTDTFTYTLRNTANTTPVLTDTATVTITVSNRVWYVNNAVTNGDGRSTSPFNTLTPVNGSGGSGDSDSPNDFIYVFTGSGNYTTGIALESGQQLIGNGVALVVNTTTLRAAGAAPTITNGGGNGVTLNLNNTISGFNVGNSSGSAIGGSSFGTVNVSNIAINTNGQALGLSTGTIAGTGFTSTTSTGGTNNVSLTNVLGTLNLGSGALSGSTNHAFFADQGNGSVNFSGTISNSATGARVVSVTAKTGGTIALSGSITSSGTNPAGVFLNNNTGATINFTGGLSLNTGTNAAFTATGGGTVSATQNNSSIINVLTTTSGTALNVANTTIGASGLTFRSISSNGAPNGINLNTTGSSGSLTVTGNGGTCTIATQTCTGGSIQSSTAEGININSSTNVNLTLIKVQNSGTDGIHATGVNGFTLTNSIVTDAAGVTQHDGIEFDNVSGTVTLTSIAVNGSPHDNIDLDNFNTNLTAFNLTNSVIQSTLAGTGANGILFVARGNSVITAATIRGCTINGNLSTGIQPVAQDTANIQNFTIGTTGAGNGNTFSNNNAGIDMNQSQSASITYNIVNNTFNNHRSQAINSFASTGSTGGAITGKIQSNIIGTAGVLDSGSAIGSGIRVIVKGGAVGSFLIDSNQIREVPNGRGMDLQGLRTASGNGGAKFKVTNNLVARPTDTNQAICGPTDPCPLASIYIASDNETSTGNETVCSVVSGNTAYDPTSWANGGEAAYYLLENTFTGPSTHNLEGTNPNPATQITSTNTVTNSTFAPVTIDGSVAVIAPGSCGTFPSMPEVFDEGTDAPTVAPAASTASATDEPASITDGSPFVSMPVQTKQSAPATATNTTRTAAAINAPTSPSVDNINLNLGTLNANDSVQIIFQATVNNPFPAGPLSVSNQGTVSGSNFASVLTDDPSVGGTSDPTVTPVDVIMLSINDVMVAEGAVGTRNVTFTISVTGTTSSPITVQVETADNTATAPADYIAVPLNTINIPGSTPSTTVTVQVNGDTIFEGNETFFVNLSNASSGTLISDGQGIGTIADDEPMTSDLDGDGLTDAAIWNSSNGNWFVRNSSTGTTTQVVEDWGRASLNDRAVPGDYDGDNKIDIAIFRTGEGNWYILKSSLGYTPFIQNWGQNGDVPVPADYDNDGVTDIAVWRPSQGNWYILKSNNGAPVNSVQNWGVGTDKPVVGDFDGDGKSDLAVFRPTEGNWYIINSSTGALTAQNWGVSTDKLVPGDYDGDGKTDIAVYRSGTWFIRKSSGGTIVKSWGDPTDLPVPGDYDGDGITDMSVWRPSEGKWYAINSSTNTVNLQTIEVTGVPVPNAYLPQ